ncbi:DNA-damage inducible protein DDI1-like protein [Leishmania mexicana MHOM/GT/2001/U1103]|uniref:DNA-damage inducible protein DDI1-like protein n=1 Tax=Leishmania mexicana (strain MHOM/GT/2001/U1103) TaxID=929439 RepID=E9AJE8_LEIMU|nr:DNA-damage inducible protein DDI1-like protein [Leishmania mexicana MHOM/GT/2001/U1103]CBZ23045.1 DNA-damage inducible protein DDI1-like protein [Leishmania mexicana MHOM/GT/2001/U1103]
MDERQVELQRRIYAQIQQQQIDENLANALEYTPEAFAKVPMLYVPCTIHQVLVKAFVDSGAQNSIMNKRTAERCGLMRLVDVRMRGVAVGVGRQEICGRIHMTPVNLAGMYIPFAFYVIEDQAMDLIIGLDQLRRHQMVIDLKHDCLTIGNINVPFLPENDLPALAGLDDDADEMHAPRHQDPAVTATTAPSPAAPVLSEGERQARMEGFMTFSGITDPKQAAELLEAADWDPNVAAALLFDT